MNAISGSNRVTSLKEDRRRRLEPSLEKAFRTVYRLLPNRQIATNVVRAALDSIDTAAVAQEDRLEKPAKLARSKTILPLSILFQRLLYVHCEPYEKLRESTDDDLSFESAAGSIVKHAAKIGLRNPQDAATVTGRVLLNTPTERLVPIYSNLAPGCPGSKDETGSAWRRKKLAIMADFKKRFRSSLTLKEVSAGAEARFLDLKNPKMVYPAHWPEDRPALTAPHIAVIEEWMRELMPWSSVNLAMRDLEIIRRFLNPRFLRDLLQDNFLLFENLMTFPLIYRNTDKLTGFEFRGRRDGVADLTEEDVQEFLKDISTDKRRSQPRKSTVLQVLADGIECGVIETGTSVSVSVPAGTDLVELVSVEDGEPTVVATHLLSYTDADDVPTPHIYRDGEGNEFRFVDRVCGNDEENEFTISLDIEYRRARGALISFRAPSSDGGMDKTGDESAAKEKFVRRVAHYSDVPLRRKTVPLERMRNTAIIGCGGTGRAIIERILYYARRSHNVGEVDESSIAMDWMEQERERGITITSAATTATWRDLQINIIDTPERVDFIAEIERSLRVIDSAIAVFDAAAEFQPQAGDTVRILDRYRVPHICFINGMGSSSGADFYRSVRAIAECGYARPVPLCIPIGVGNTFEGVFDLIEMKGLTWSGPMSDVAFIPEEVKEKAQLYRDQLIEAISEVDDTGVLFAKFVEGTPPTTAEIKEGIRMATIGLKIAPVICESDLTSEGMRALLNAIVEYLPSPLDKSLIKPILEDPCEVKPAQDLRKQHRALILGGATGAGKTICRLAERLLTLNEGVAAGQTIMHLHFQELRERYSQPFYVDFGTAITSELMQVETWTSGMDACVDPTVLFTDCSREDLGVVGASCGGSFLAAFLHVEGLATRLASSTGHRKLDETGWPQTVTCMDISRSSAAIGRVGQRGFVIPVPGHAFCFEAFDENWKSCRIEREAFWASYVLTGDPKLRTDGVNGYWGGEQPGEAIPGILCMALSGKILRFSIVGSLAGGAGSAGTGGGVLGWLAVALELQERRGRLTQVRDLAELQDFKFRSRICRQSHAYVRAMWRCSITPGTACSSTARNSVDIHGRVSRDFLRQLGFHDLLGGLSNCAKLVDRDLELQVLSWIDSQGLWDSDGLKPSCDDEQTVICGTHPDVDLAMKEIQRRIGNTRKSKFACFWPSGWIKAAGYRVAPVCLFIATRSEIIFVDLFGSPDKQEVAKWAVLEYRIRLIEALAERDDDLFRGVMEHREIGARELKTSFASAVDRCEVVPVAVMLKIMTDRELRQPH